MEDGIEMKTKIFIWIFVVLAITLFHFTFGTVQSKANSKGPIITHCFAVETGKYAYIWKIYLEAEDPTGDMSKIVSTVDQLGWGQYFADTILIKPQNRHHLKGYIQLNTFSSETPTLDVWTQITVKISIIDKARNESNVVVFPLTFEPGEKNKYKYKLPSPFDQGDLPMLGHIDINIFSPFMGPFDSPVR
jgi:hypothetical protein